MKFPDIYTCLLLNNKYIYKLNISILMNTNVE